MDFFDAVKKRRSTRAYSEKPIDAKKLTQLLEAVNSAPSARILLSYEIFVAKTDDKKKALFASSSGKDYVFKAPVVLVFCANPKRVGVSAARPMSKEAMELLAIEDATIAASYCQLAATALGLSTVWIGSFNRDDVLKAIRDTEGLIPITVMPVGYPAEEPEAKPRRSLSELVHEI